MCQVLEVKKRADSVRPVKSIFPSAICLLSQSLLLGTDSSGPPAGPHPTFGSFYSPPRRQIPMNGN